MVLSDYNYNLPKTAIATHPPVVRGSTKLLVLQKESGAVSHKTYADFSHLPKAGDVVVLNDTRVIKARLTTVNANGQPRELLLLEKHGNTFGAHRHHVLYKGKLTSGEKLWINKVELYVDEVLNGGIAIISSEQNLLDLSDSLGSVPLPPYIKRAATKNDEKRYQTIFAKKSGSVAAPTASLNFTGDIKESLEKRGVHIAYITLHVGLGTFLPIREDDIANHQMHSEYFEVPEQTTQSIRNAKENNKKIYAVGTTVARTLEFCSKEIMNKDTKDLRAEADIFIYPGFSFNIVDKLLTNFHAPRSTVLMLAAAFAGWDQLKAAYEEALKKEYMFLSYGDSMLIE